MLSVIFISLFLKMNKMKIKDLHKQLEKIAKLKKKKILKIIMQSLPIINGIIELHFKNLPFL